MKSNRMSAHFAHLAVIWIVAFSTHVTRATHMVVCSEKNHGRSCSLGSNAESLAVFGNRVFVGVLNGIYSFKWDLSLVYGVPLTPEEDRYTRCYGHLAFSPSTNQCHNYIRFIQQIPSRFKTNDVDKEQVLVCGTGAFSPKCTIHESASLSNYSFMTSREDAGYSPFALEDHIIAILASNGRFFSATSIRSQENPLIRMAKNPLGRDSLFHVQTPLNYVELLYYPHFISTYEIDAYIYFFITERAYELQRIINIVYSRVIRICKSDNGQRDSNQISPFLTFQKARMKCTVRGEQNTVPYNYDNLESTFLLNKTGQPLTLYGIFSSPENGPKGSAICKYSFEPSVTGSLTQVFQKGNYRVPVDTTNYHDSEWITETSGPFSCPGDTSGSQRTVEQSNRYQLIDDVVVDYHPRHIVSGEKLGKIAVDVITFNGSVQEIIYYSTESGEIHQALHVKGSNGVSSQLQDHVLLRVNGTVTYLNVYCINLDTQHWQVYATAGNTIATITRGDCLTQYYGNCFECLDSRDPYCVWSTEIKACLNKVSQVSDGIIGLYEAISVTEETITSDRVCGARPDPQE